MPRTKAPVRLQDLIRMVEERSPGPQPLDRVALAVKYGEALKGLGDDLIGHFVDEARATGCSWAQIGANLGVTKQAAQQRHRLGRLFARRPGRGERWFVRFTSEARQVVVVAQEEARNLKHNYIGTEHLLLGLLRDRQGTAAPAFRSAGISLQDVRREVKRIIGTGSEVAAGRMPFTPRAKKALDLSLRAASARGDSHIGGQHILIGLLEEGEGVAAHILRDHGLTLESVHESLAK
jgi:hypothetical protein